MPNSFRCQTTPAYGANSRLNLVAHAKADLAGAEAGADAAIGIVLAREAELDERLQDQAVGQQHLVLGLEPAAMWPDSPT